MKEGAGRSRSRWVAIGLIALAALAFVLRVYGANASIAYSTDSDVVRMTMHLGYQLVAGDHEGFGSFVVYKYPLTLCVYLLAVYGMTAGFSLVAGLVPSIGAIREFVFLHRELVHLVAVYGLAVIGAALVPLMFVAARALNPRHTGWIAAALAACSALLVHFGHQPRPHVALATFALLALMLLVQVAQGSSWRWALAATIASALTFGVHQIGATIVAPFAVAWLIRVLRNRSAGLRRAIGECLLHFVLFGVFCVLVYPSIARDVFGLMHTFVTGGSEFRFGSGAHQFKSEDVDTSNVVRLLVCLYWYQPLLVATAPITLGYLCWKLRARIEVLAPTAAFLCFLVLLMGSFSATFPRMTATLVPFFILAAAHAIEDAALLLARRTNRSPGIVMILVGALALAPPLLTASRLSYVTAQADTRTLARAWFEGKAGPGETVLANFQIPEHLPSTDSLRRQAEDAPETVGTLRKWLLSRVGERMPPEPAFHLIDYSGVWPADSSAQEAFVRERRIRWAVYQVRYWRSLVETGAISEFLGTHGDLVGAICPASGLSAIPWPERGPARPSEIYLPEDVETDVWRHIWQVDRPGPIMLLFAVGESRKRAAPSRLDMESVCG